MAVESEQTAPTATAPVPNDSSEPTLELTPEVAVAGRVALAANGNGGRSSVAVAPPPAPPAMPAPPRKPAPLPLPVEAEAVVVLPPDSPDPPAAPHPDTMVGAAPAPGAPPEPTVKLDPGPPAVAAELPTVVAEPPVGTGPPAVVAEPAVAAGPAAGVAVEAAVVAASPAAEAVAVGPAVAAAKAAASTMGPVDRPPVARIGLVRQPWAWGVAVLAVVLLGGILALATRDAGSQASADGQGGLPALQSSESTIDRTAATENDLRTGLSVTPAVGADSVPLDAVVTVKTTTGKLAGIQAATADGAAVPGTLTTDGRTWQSTDALAPGATYTVSGQVVADDGTASVPVTGSFSTLTPAATVKATVYPTDDDVVGVGQPIVFKFSKPITTDAARQAVISHLTVAASQPVAAGWHWFGKQELHLRPQEYWPAGDKITVVTDLNGWNAGDGTLWGTGGVEVHFTIGDAHVSTADLSTHKMVVTSNGAVVATYPFSGGREKYPTMNGVHLTMTKEPVRHMVSSTVGIPVDSPDGYDELVYNAVRITDGGEFVHAAPWSVGSQGSTNVSHGCINLSNANSKTFMDFSLLGDVVIVKGGPRSPELGDHGVMDWSSDWGIFTPATVLRASADGTPIDPTTQQPVHVRPLSPDEG